MGGNEAALVEAVERWAARHRLPERAPVAAAQALAISMYRDGAAPGDARARAEGFLRSWASHPSNGIAGSAVDSTEAVRRPHLRAVS